MNTEVTGVSFLLFSVLSSVILIFVAKYVWKRRFLYYYSWKLDGPLAFPVIGSAYLFTGGPEAFLKKFMEIVEKYHSTSTISKLWLGSNLFIVTTELNDVEMVLNNCLEKAWFYDFGKQALGDSLLLGPVKIWRPHRKIISRTFNQKTLNSFYNIFINHTNALVKKLDDSRGNDYIDVFPFMFQNSLNTICETSMGLSVEDMEGTNQYMNWLTRGQSLLTIRLFQFWLHPELIWKLSSMFKEYSSICVKIWDFVGSIVERKRNEKMASSTLTTNSIKDKDMISKQKIFLDFIIDITDTEGRWTNQELTEEAHLMVFGGSETTAITQSAALVMLAMHQDIQSKVYKEIFEIFGNSERLPTPEDLNRMIYLEMVIKETLRLCPLAPFIAREVSTDLKLEHGIVPKGSVVFVPNIFLQRSSRFWKDPVKFDPDRFRPEEVAKRHRCVYIPFSAGPRDCLGKRYAMISMKIVLSTVLRHFRMVSTDYKTVADIELKMNVMVKAKDGYKVKMERRNKAAQIIL